MKKIVSIFILLFALVSCSQDVSRDGNSIKATKDGVLWKPALVTANRSVDGTMEITALLRDETLTMNVASYNAATYLFGPGYNNSATYTYMRAGVPVVYKTANAGGNGNFIITDYDPVDKTIRGTFKLNATTDIENPDVPKTVNFIKGFFFDITFTEAP